MSKSDLIRLRHTLEAAREAVKFKEGHTPSDLNRNPVWALGLVKCVEIIGEAAARISGEGKAECPHIPWPPSSRARTEDEDSPSIGHRLSRFEDGEQSPGQVLRVAGPSQSKRAVSRALFAGRRATALILGMASRLLLLLTMIAEYKRRQPLAARLTAQFPRQ